MSCVFPRPKFMVEAFGNPKPCFGGHKEINLITVPHIGWEIVFDEAVWLVQKIQIDEYTIWLTVLYVGE